MAVSIANNKYVEPRSFYLNVVPGILLEMDVGFRSMKVIRKEEQLGRTSVLNWT